MTAAARRPPGPKGKPVVGSLPEFSRDALQMLLDGWREHGDVVRFRLGPRTIYLVVAPEDLKRMLVDRHLSYPHPRFFDARLAAVARHGVISMEGQSWVERREALEACFSPDRLPPLEGPIVDSIAAELDRWADDAAAGAERVVKDDVYDLGLTIVGRLLFGAAWEAHAGTIKPALRTYLEQIDRLLSAPFNTPAWIPLPANLRYLAARRRYEQTVESARQALPANGAGGLLGMLGGLRDVHGGALGAEQVRNELTHVYMAGWSTMAAAFMWTCYLLGRNPQAEEALRAECAAVLGERRPTLADLERLPYARMVAKEVLRLYPPLWLGSRSPLDDDELGGFRLPAGAFVSYSSYLTHRHPDYWTEPEQFDPLRWSPERDEPRSPYAYLPFSFGPRSCLGDEVAKAAVGVFAPMLVQRYRLRTVEEHPIEHHLGITISAKHGVKVALSPA